jgi:hypothetical protein
MRTPAASRLPARLFTIRDGARYGRQSAFIVCKLRTRAKEILGLAGSTEDLEVRDMRRVIAASYEKLALRAEQREAETV